MYIQCTQAVACALQTTPKKLPVPTQLLMVISTELQLHAVFHFVNKTRIMWRMYATAALSNRSARPTRVLIKTVFATTAETTTPWMTNQSSISHIRRSWTLKQFTLQLTWPTFTIYFYVFLTQTHRSRYEWCRFTSGLTGGGRLQSSTKRMLILSAGWRRAKSLHSLPGSTTPLPSLGL